MREQERKKGRHDEGQYPNRENDEYLSMANPLLLFLVGQEISRIGCCMHLRSAMDGSSVVRLLRLVDAVNRLYPRIIRTSGAANCGRFFVTNLGNKTSRCDTPDNLHGLRII